jgi:cytochrome c-type biogenesis protein CcmH/NrfG
MVRRGFGLKPILVVLGLTALFLPSCETVPASPSGAVSVSAGTGAAELSGKVDTGNSGSVSDSSVSGSGGTILAVPSKDKLKRNSLDQAVLSLLETGSPDSIRQAVERINADPRGMTDQNRVALAVAGELMKILYPLERITWPSPAIPDTGVWIGAIKAARQGAYDYGAGSSDFLALVLPSLVLSVTNAPGDYYAEAEAALKKAASGNDRSVLPPYLLALLYEREGKQSAADSLYLAAWERDRSCYPAGVAYARSLIRADSGMRALSVAKELLVRYPESTLMTRLAADAAFSTGDWTLADPYVLQAIKAEPDNADYLLMRARILVERKDYLKANALLDAFSTRSKEDKQYLLLRSRVVREWNRNPASAMVFLQDAQRLYPDDEDVLLASAEVCYQTGQTINKKGGRDFVALVLAKSPNNPDALSLLVADYIASGDWQNAVKHGERLVSVSPRDSSKVLLVRACLGAGQPGRAITLARALYQASTTDEVTSLYLESLVVTGDLAQAGAIIGARLPSAPSTLKSILYYYESRTISDPDARLSSLRSSLLADPRNKDALYAMYGWYFAKADYRKAQYYLKQVIALDPSNRQYAQELVKLDEMLAR